MFLFYKSSSSLSRQLFSCSCCRVLGCLSMHNWLPTGGENVERYKIIFFSVLTAERSQDLISQWTSAHCSKGSTRCLVNMSWKCSHTRCKSYISFSRASSFSQSRILEKRKKNYLVCHQYRIIQILYDTREISDSKSRRSWACDRPTHFNPLKTQLRRKKNCSVQHWAGRKKILS